MLNFSRALALAAALCSLPAFGADIDALFRARWVQAESKHFRVVTDQDAETARLMVNDLEHMRHFSSRALGIEALDTVGPLTVLAIGNTTLFDKLGLPENYGGLFSYTLRGFAAIGNVKGYVGDSNTPTFARNVLLHEYHHFLIRMTERTVAYPMWCDEGLAEYFSTFRYDNTSVTVGDVDEQSGRISGLFGPSGGIDIDTETLFNTTKLDYIKTTRTNKMEINAFYARAGFVVHYFNSSPELRAQLNHYLRLYNLGIGQEHAARLAFKRSYAELDKDIARYLVKRLSVRVFKATDGPFKFPTVDIQVQTLDQPRVTAALAAVLTRVSMPRDAIEAVVARNLQDNPDSAQAHIDRLRFSPTGYGGATVRALSERFPGNAQLLDMLGDTMLNHGEALRAAGLPGWQAQMIKARDQFRLAAKADPGYPATYRGLGQVYLNLPDGEALDDGITGFDTASIFQRSPDMFRGLATLALRARDTGQALAALRHAVTFTKPSRYSEDALLLDNLELLNDARESAPSPTADGLAYKSGTRYVGQVNGLKPDGAGKLVRINGSYIEGTFRDGLPLTGKLVSARGGEYEGQFDAGIAGGEGALRYPKGAPATSYAGGVALGKPSGHGVLIDATGRYEGGFVNGEPHGEGGFTPAAKPVTVRGKWLYGRYVWPAANGEVFVGAIDASGQPSGEGYCYVAATNSGLRECRRGDERSKVAKSDD
ncbi:Uncharacterized conserved protein [Duganella sp. CF517]|uniref:hypothetical protein n=1 Tax=Duganella sp. CF517 TaxID=1881038 RepID=UPI0008CAE760|nr:hypothetical protein [Duganella sp. CF517]SEN30999.1 Uncharacterized conserved protein [Duganella sp. CF517]